MKLEYLPVRRTIDGLLPKGPKTSHLYETLASKIEGMKIVENGNPRGDSRYRGADYVFGYIIQEPWAETGLGAMEELWSDTAKFLEGKGYREVKKPQKGDVVAYFNSDYSAVLLDGAHLGQAIAKHFGVFQDKRVISKWS